MTAPVEQQRQDTLQVIQGLDKEASSLNLQDLPTQTTEPAAAVLDPSRSHDPEVNKKQSDPFAFGNRHLKEDDDVYEFNAWDNVEPDDDHLAFTEVQFAKQRESPVSDFDKRRFNSNPASWWNKFYKNNAGNFFKDRKWLQQEFPILTEIMKEEHGPVTLLEVGAGAGNTAFPILNHNRNPSLKIHACDYSKTAVDVMRNSDQYNTGQIGVMQADFWDAASADELPPGLTEASVDIVMMIFIFSALEPFQWDQAVRNIYKVLKPGGLLCFRDYGHGDLAQVRFKKGRYMEENFYVRGDGTRVYFFKQEDLTKIWTGRSPDEVLREDAHFEQLDLGVDRRLIVNRSKQLKMYRCWMQGRFQKPVTAAPADSTSPNPTT